MKVQLAYKSNVTQNVCRKHYDNPPEWMPPLGAVQDARNFGCDACAREKGRVVSVDAKSVRIEIPTTKVVKAISWDELRSCAAALVPANSAAFSQDHPDDVAIHDAYVPLLAEARRMAKEAGLMELMRWSDAPFEWLDPDETAKLRAEEAEAERIRIIDDGC